MDPANARNTVDDLLDEIKARRRELERQHPELCPVQSAFLRDREARETARIDRKVAAMNGNIAGKYKAALLRDRERSGAELKRKQAEAFAQRNPQFASRVLNDAMTYDERQAAAADAQFQRSGDVLTATLNDMGA